MIDPSEQRPWVDAQSPGTTVVDALQENRLLVNQPAEVPARCSSQLLSIQFREQVHTDYAVTLRRGKISIIQRVIGAVNLPALSISSGNLYLLLADTPPLDSRGN